MKSELTVHVKRRLLSSKWKRDVWNGITRFDNNMTFLAHCISTWLKMLRKVQSFVMHHAKYVWRKRWQQLYLGVPRVVSALDCLPDLNPGVRTPFDNFWAGALTFGIKRGCSLFEPKVPWCLSIWIGKMWTVFGRVMPTYGSLPWTRGPLSFTGSSFYLRNKIHKPDDMFTSVYFLIKIHTKGHVTIWEDRKWKGIVWWKMNSEVHEVAHALLLYILKS